MSRKLDINENVFILIVYVFLYKYISDNLIIYPKAYIS